MVVPAEQSPSSPTARWRTPDEMELDQVGACRGAAVEVSSNTCRAPCTRLLQAVCIHPQVQIAPCRSSTRVGAGRIPHKGL